MECKKGENINKCSCTYPGCSRKGVCCECIRYHLKQNELPACCFPKEIERTFDRSFDMFVKVHSR